MGFWEDLAKPPEIKAHMALREQGSVMARDQEPEWRRNNPLLGTVIQMIDSILGGVSPLDAGGGKMAQILPSTWKAAAPEAKAMMNIFGDKFPVTFAELLAQPQKVIPSVTKELPGQAAAVLRKSGGTHKLMVRPEYAKELATPGHEIQHSLNERRVAGTDPLDALTIGTLMRDLLPSGTRGSLNTILGQAVQKPSLMDSIGQLFGGNPAPLQVAPRASRDLMRAAMDEAFAYTAQNAATSSKASPLLKTLAQNLGLKWE